MNVKQSVSMEYNLLLNNMLLNTSFESPIDGQAYSLIFQGFFHFFW